MDISDPRIDPDRLPQGSYAVVIAEHQQEYRDLPSIRTPRGQVITRWTPSNNERAAIAAGADIYVTLLSKGAINPVIVSLGDQDFKMVEEVLQP